MNILIVDDVRAIREGLKRTIASEFPEAEIRLARSAMEALEAISNRSTDIVLLDIMMPGMSGLELLEKGRAIDKRIRWIVVSAYNHFHFAQEAMRHGARDYLLKPIGREKLIERIRGMREELGEENEAQSDSLTLSRNLKYLQGTVFKRWITGLVIDGFDLSKLAGEYKEFRLIVVYLHADRELELHQFIVDNVLSEMIGYKRAGLFTSFGERKMIGLLADARDEAAAEFERDLRGILDRTLKEEYTLEIGPVQSDFSSIPANVRKMGTPVNPLPKRIERGVDRPESSSGDAPSRLADKLIRNDDADMMDVALQYIRAHYQENVSLERVASAVYLNPSYFSLLFKQKMGFGYKDYVIHLRMEKAKELLAQMSLKVSEVAERIGYTDMRHFTQVFRKTFGMTPSAYRSTLGNGEDASE